MFIGHRETNLTNLIAALKSRFGHVIECVLNRFALMTGEGFDQRLSNYLPTRAKAGIRNCVYPPGVDRRREDTIASFSQSGVRILIYPVKAEPAVRNTGNSPNPPETI